MRALNADGREVWPAGGLVILMQPDLPMLASPRPRRDRRLVLGQPRFLPKARGQGRQAPLPPAPGGPHIRRPQKGI